MSTDHERDDARRRALEAGITGCPDCNSHDVITEDPNDSAILDVWIRHEETCPTLAIFRAHGLAE